MSDEKLKAIRHIFIIGPMAAKGTALPNIFNIKSAVEAVLASLSIENIKVDIPQQQYGSSIPTDVFSAIDISDLVIADVSTRSPSVIYELAFAHALGTPTIVIGDIRKKPVFYLSQTRTLLDMRSADTLQAGLQPRIKQWMEDEAPLSDNPLTSFYDRLPLVDVSAVAGIAAGYVENFLTPVMKAKDIEQPGGSASPIAIVVVVPESLDHLDAFQAEVRAQLTEDFPGSVIAPRLAVSADQREARTVTYVRRVVVDVPRTVFPLRRSKRVERLHGQAAKDMERKLLTRFRSTLEKMAEKDREIDSSRLHVVTLAQLTNTMRKVVK